MKPVRLRVRQSLWWAGAFFVLLGLLFAAPRSKPPTRLTFAARPGTVVFDHRGHARRVKGDCTACHDKLFPMDAHAPLHWKEGMHKPAEANHTSCGGCHRPAGPAFPSYPNCRRCHGPEPNI